ncbi:unnamed protein product [Cladocopium goreaui]|uniref:Uncharacterized protein n=1 Tax=Cladocopium goreaui TaxID=2562237 RepID=A0A9P1CX55_9DINO|nr:unnamed protein product [Cladocopium goreaui]
MTATVQLPMTLEALLSSDEPGTEAQFCPVLKLPIKRTHRVRTLPGFHLLSLEAGKEAMAQGSYEAFSQRFRCEGLEHLHPEDKVFICPQDNKAFLNQMSMRYHQYIRHELQERKAERKRLRERAEERRARADRHRQPDVARLGPTGTPTTPPPGDKNEPGAKIRRVTWEQGTQFNKDSPEVPQVPVVHEATSPWKRRSEADPRLAAPPVAKPVAPLTPATPVTPMTPVVPESSIVTEKPLPSEEDDLYGNIGGNEAKDQPTGSSYASAMNAMLKGDFEDDEL